jgi:hypothetical protein
MSNTTDDRQAALAALRIALERAEQAENNRDDGEADEAAEEAIGAALRYEEARKGPTETERKLSIATHGDDGVYEAIRSAHDRASEEVGVEHDPTEIEYRVWFRYD